MKKKFVEDFKDLTLDIPNIVETTIQQNEDELAIAEELLDYETSEEVKKKLLISDIAQRLKSRMVDILGR
jgi:hypothetical protein|tara:strand:+ start:347 stop:556 length:210 start_codon:yes stop_codon:yes gene_type:complete